MTGRTRLGEWTGFHVSYSIRGGNVRFNYAVNAHSCWYTNQTKEGKDDRDTAAMIDRIHDDFKTDAEYAEVDGEDIWVDWVAVIEAFAHEFHREASRHAPRTRRR